MITIFACAIGIALGIGIGRASMGQPRHVFRVGQRVLFRAGHGDFEGEIKVLVTDQQYDGAYSQASVDVDCSPHVVYVKNLRPAPPTPASVDVFVGGYRDGKNA